MAKAKKYKPDTVRHAFRKFFSGDEIDGEQRAYCPVCEDPGTSSSPSASFNPDAGLWHCKGKCNGGGTIYDLVQDLKRERGFDIRSAAMEGRHLDPAFASQAEENLKRSSKRSTRKAKLPDDDQIMEWHENLLGNRKALSRIMERRGWTKETVKHFRIGWNGSRYTIPIYDEDGSLANVRRYKLDAKSHGDKMLNVQGHGQARIYGIEELEGNRDILLVEGEPDRILAHQELAEHEIGVVCHTAGAHYFKASWAGLFQDKRVWICYDLDDVGKRGASKVKKILSPYADATFIMELPLSTSGADVTDYFHGEGYSAQDFLTLMKEAESSSSERPSGPVPLNGRVVSLQESMSEENQNETLELIVSVAGKQAEPYTAPRKVEALCDISKGAVCTLCPVAAKNGSVSVELRSDDENLPRFVDSTETRRRQLLREIIGARCTDRVDYNVPEEYHIEELLVQPSVDNRRDDETQQPIRRTIYSVSTYRSAVNEKIRLVGSNYADPKTGRLRFIAWLNQAVELDIDRFQLSEDDREILKKKFRPHPSQDPLDKCIEIAHDLAENVTHIYQRPMLHVCYDLVWHSVQSFRLGNSTETKGWLECLIIGDTRTGKSEVAHRLLKHYNSGHMLSCEGMSFAGIVGGVQQIDGRWHLTWGAVPMNDRRLVILDEMSGLKDKDVIDQMSSIRSSGVAQITKISSESTSARTRLIWISNPADGSMIADSPDVGMAAMRTVVPNAEDIARFDFVASTAAKEVPPRAMNSGATPLHDPEYKSEECELLIKWIWSLTRDDVIITTKAQKAAERMAENLGSRYIPDPPLIQVENVRIKILRIAAAIAGRTFSCDKRDKLLVYEEHVRDAVRFLDMIYEQESMGYARRSRRAIAAARKARERKDVCRAYLLEHRDTVLQTLRMVGGSTFRTRDFEEFGAMDRDSSHIAVGQLLKMRMVHRKTRGDMGMNPTLLEILRELEDEEE